MSIILFTVGRSGSGKSTAIRYMKQVAESKKCSTCYISDYEILLEMSKHDKYREKFCLNQYNGFDILDFSVMNVALEELKKRITILNNYNENDVILVEFARDTYAESFHLLKSTFSLEDAYILFIEAGLDVCIKRIYERVRKSQGPNCHFISENIMRTYFREDNFSYMNTEFEKEFDIQKHHLKVICNQTTVSELEIQIDDITKYIFQEALSLQKVPSGA